MISTKNAMSNILSIISKRCKDDIFLMTNMLYDLFLQADLEEKFLECTNPLDFKISYDETCRIAELLNVTPSELLK